MTTTRPHRAGALQVLTFLLVIGALAAGGCGSVGWLRDATPALSEPARKLARADELAREGQLRAARDLYQELSRDPARDALHATALYRLGRLYTEPASGFLDYRVARAAFERLLAEYPKGAWEADARAWRATLVELHAREAEIARLRGEAARLKGDAHTREIEAARLREETAKLKADLQRLKKIDMEFDRRR